MMAVSQEYLDRLRTELHLARNVPSTANILGDQLGYAYSQSTTKTDADLLQKDKNILAAFLGCVGYEFVDGRMQPKAHHGDMIYSENLLAGHKIENVIFEFSDDRGNLSVIAYYTGDDLHFCATNNFVRANAPWYLELPVLEAAFNVQENTFWFMYRPHCLVGKLDKNGKFMACRIMDLLSELDESSREINIEALVGLLDKKHDPKLTAEALSKEIEPEEEYGLPDLFEGLKNLGVF